MSRSDTSNRCWRDSRTISARSISWGSCCCARASPMTRSAACAKRSGSVRSPIPPHCRTTLRRCVSLAAMPTRWRVSTKRSNSTPIASDLWNSRGLVLDELGRYDAAVASFEQSVALRSDVALPHYNLANALSSLREFARALDACDRALALDPGFALAWFGRSQTSKVLGNQREALAAFEKYLLLATPRDLPQWQDIVGLGRNLFAFDLTPAIYPHEAAIDAERARLDTLLNEIEQQVKVIAALPSLPGVILNAIFSVASFNIAYQQRNDSVLSRRYADVLQQVLRIQSAPQTARAARRSKIRLGIASAQLKDHNGTRWALDWLAQLPRGDYSFFIYAFNSDLDEISKRFAALGGFRHLVFSERAFLQTIAAMRNDQLDVLHARCRHDAGKPHLGAVSDCADAGVGLGPSGHDWLSQHRLLPVERSHGATRRAGALYREVDPASQPRALPQAVILRRRRQLPFDLPEDRVLCGCLQSLYKYLPQFDGVFPRVAARLPTACFLFIEGNPASLTTSFRDRLREAFEREGLGFERFCCAFCRECRPASWRAVEADRCEHRFHRLDRRKAPPSNHWNRYCPVVTLPGEFMRGRHSYAMLRMIGIDELIAASLDEFVDITVRLGSDQVFRAAVVEKIAQSKHRLYEDAGVHRGARRILQIRACRTEGLSVKTTTPAGITWVETVSGCR